MKIFPVLMAQGWIPKNVVRSSILSFHSNPSLGLLADLAPSLLAFFCAGSNAQADLFSLPWYAGSVDIASTPAPPILNSTSSASRSFSSTPNNATFTNSTLPSSSSLRSPPPLLPSTPASPPSSSRPHPLPSVALPPPSSQSSIPFTSPDDKVLQPAAHYVDPPILAAAPRPSSLTSSSVTSPPLRLTDEGVNPVQHPYRGPPRVSSNDGGVQNILGADGKVAGLRRDVERRDERSWRDEEEAKRESRRGNGNAEGARIIERRLEMGDDGLSLFLVDSMLW